MGLPVAVAVLLGGILSPTDPVLAASVQVGPPGSGAENEVRFSLTAEAGLNDGLAFPFVNLGLLMLARGTAPDAWLGQWLLIDVAWKLPAAALIGFVLGWGLVHVSQQLPEPYQLPRSRDGLTSVGLTLIAYGLAEMAHTYGFVAVFVTAATLRNTGHEVDYARRLHDFAEQTERLASFLVLALFGAALVGGLLGPLSWADAVFAALTLFVVRPLATLVGFLGSRQPLLPQLAMGYFGIRGLGSLYYAIYVTNKAGVPDTQHLWAVVALVVLVSILVYGLSANPVMRRLDEQCRLRSPSPARERAPNLG